VVGAALVVDVGKTDPHEVAEQETVHITPLAVTSFTRVAVNCSDVLSNNVALVLSSETLINGGGGGGDVVEPPPQPKLAASRVAMRNTPRSATRFFGDMSASI
jgi:hypothetical protein